MDTLGIDTLQKERTQLQEDFSKLGAQVKQVETDLGQMKANLNAINGALQEVNKLIGLIEPKDLPRKKK
jgi:septal ring factor EnvC (AmiA/AmiB activator)|tara:strand:- start:4133 stop:4339 length:207 start_codon:yes stop_codon:yes gene_type:complete